LYWEKCATDTGLKTFSKSVDKQHQSISLNL
jgi:hypothetical protein